ncbi:MAG TPA: lactate racemase domain-containing protein [Planctomycetota bacterium]|nr:lactate racemase domain-containing protein [Planctomycetota bacterium]
MRIEIPFGSEIKLAGIDLPAENVTIAKSADPRPSGTWAELMQAALPTPLGARPIRENDLRGKRVAVITDDWARPTPASEVVPIILRELNAAGAADDAISFVTASGMHDPMSRDDLLRKLGPEAMVRCTCIAHDAGDHDSLAFVGISEQGTPIWVNRAVAEADYKVALGRIFPHTTHGYEGGYKIILPGVSGFETITRDHSFNFSALSVAGLLDNPSRRETDAVGKIVGIDFLINVVVNHRSEPVRAFCGEPMEVHRTGVEYGDRHVWGARIPGQADIVIASPGSGSIPSGEYDMATLTNAARAAKESGVIICLSRDARPFTPPRDGDSKANPAVLNGPRDQFDAMLPTLSLSELLRLHDKRDWQLPDREIQWRIKGVRGDFYRRRALQEITRRRVVLTDDPSRALADTLAGMDTTGIRVIVLPEGRTTLPKEKLCCSRP